MLNSFLLIYVDIVFLSYAFNSNLRQGWFAS